MAVFMLKDYVDINNFNDIVAVSWEVSIDDDFGSIVADTIYDTENILMWRDPIVNPSTGKSYLLTHDKIYARCKIYTKNGNKVSESDWFVAKEIDPTHGVKKISYKGRIIDIVTKD